VAKNAAALVTRPALEGNWAEALAAFDTDRQVNGLGLDTRADTVDGLTAMLADSGVEPIAWYGVRLFTDSRPPHSPAPVPMIRLLRSGCGPAAGIPTGS